jgi:hypothetical protein
VAWISGKRTLIIEKFSGYADHVCMRKILIVFLSVLPVLMCTVEAQDVGGSDRQQGSAATQGQNPVLSDEQTKVPSDFVRFVKIDDGGHLDTAVTTYEKDGVKVIFYGAVHIADRAIYQEMNKRFKTCDALLYELVGPEDYRPTKDRESTGFNPVAMMQLGMKQSLGLTFQLDEVDYQPENFVHADMTPEEFQSSMLEHGESLMSIMVDMMINGMQTQRDQRDADEQSSKPKAKFDLVKAFRSREGQHLMRVTFAGQLEEMEMMAAGGDGSTLLEGRNEKCLRVLRREIGKGKKRLGIYYGAAHLPHMERRLVEDMGFKKVAHEWLVAWDCKKRLDPKKDMKLAKLIRTCKRDMAKVAKVGKEYRKVHATGLKAVPKSVRALKDYGVEAGQSYGGPFTDPWGSDFRITGRRWGSRWKVISNGPDKLPDTDDDIKIDERR